MSPHRRARRLGLTETATQLGVSGADENKMAATKTQTHTTALLLVALLIATSCTAMRDGSGKPLPVDAMATALANETNETEFSFDEVRELEYSTDWHFKSQGFPSSKIGSRGGGYLWYFPQTNESSGAVIFEITPPANAIALPKTAQLGPTVGVKLTAGINCQSISVISRDIQLEIGQPDEGETLIGDIDPDPNDPICTFIFPGILAQRILPPNEQPQTLEEYFNTLKTHDFVHTHSIRMYGERIRVYTWETNENGITEKREIGLNNDNKLFYINWWRSEPYEGENVNRRNLARSCRVTCE